MPNRLATETSPYLLQHAHNPVDWYPWGPEALEEAAITNRPILLSIGYAACHWCHVMERESFENHDTAAQMNRDFVCIKVDREERPDIDAIYMQATQAMTGHGGWPMTVFLTPAGEPFHAGTYYPPEDRHGMPGVPRLLAGIAEAWRSRQSSVRNTAAQMRELYAASREITRATATLDAALLDRAAASLRQRYEPRFGGFDGAPKFPPTMALDFALRQWARTGDAAQLDMVRHTFLSMARGGIHDQVGGGFSRYSVDAYWLVPHFEKMLYDNALLVRLGAHLAQATGDAEVRRVTGEIIDWLFREMTSPEGGFYASLDADSEGHEGRFYVWDASEFDTLLGEDASLMRAYWGVTADGNFEGRNILFVPHDPVAFAEEHSLTVHELESAIERARRILLEARSHRVRPARDDKIIACWNGLMLRGLADVARITGDDELRAHTLRSATFVFDSLVENGRTWRTFTQGEARIPGFLEDHAALGLAAIALYQLEFDTRWLAHADALTAAIVQQFWSDEIQAFYDTASDSEPLVTRPRDVTDNAIPSGSSLAVELLLLVGVLRGNDAYVARASHALETVAEPMARFPTAFGHALCAADLLVRGSVELVIAGTAGDPQYDALLQAAREYYLPSLLLVGGRTGDERAPVLLADRGAEDRVLAYLCVDRRCDLPAENGSQLRAQIERLRAGMQAS